MAASKGVPDVPTVYAADGTCTHYISEQSLRNGTEPHAHIGKTYEFDGFKFKVDEERADRAKLYVDRIRARVGRRMVEVKLDTSKVVGVPGQGGTGDCVIFNRAARQVESHDLKDGRGIVFAWVDPGPDLPRWRGANAQLMEYLASALELADLLGGFDSGLIAIHQPKIGHYDEAVFTRAEIEAWVAWARPREQLACRLWESGTPEEIRSNMTPSAKACEWCPIRGSCPARAGELLSLFPIAPDAAEQAELPAYASAKATDLSDADLAEARSRVDEIEGWCRDVQAEALRRAIAGRALPGWKVVTGKLGNRAYTDAEKVEAAIADGIDITEGVGDERKTIHVAGIADEATRKAAYTAPELKSPAQLETALKKKHKTLWEALQTLITRAPGSPSLVRDHDARAPLNVAKVEFSLAPVGAEDLL